MFSNEFLSEFSEILEVDLEDLNDSFTLDENTWSSLVLLSTIALIDDHFHKTVRPHLIVKTTSLAELYTLLTDPNTPSQ